MRVRELREEADKLEAALNEEAESMLDAYRPSPNPINV